jgi:hypothetical protein
MASVYAKSIRDILQRTGRTEIDPAIIEAWMRVEHATLDHLSPEQFTTSVCTAWALATVTHPDDNAGLAATYGLRLAKEARERPETLAEEHMRRVHGDGSECRDGCDDAPLRHSDDDAHDAGRLVQ